jgi:1-acyl-sn-glycerol-3-phosphate acyltransferase
VQKWSAELLDILNVNLVVRGSFGAGKTLIVANHISWLDIFLINTIAPVRFVAKADVRKWPGIGWLVEKAGTLFIERGRRNDAIVANHRIAGLLAVNEKVAFFPEGTTSRGDRVLPFYASLFQSAVEAEAYVQPIVIRYVTGNKGACDPTPSYALLDSFVGSLARILSARTIYAELHFTPPIAAEGRDRRQLAKLAETAVAGAFGGEPASWLAA